jgi:nanoRNase/pAp phosphatase (c-di-AMP/oligoRNAs hydrolase)
MEYLIGSKEEFLEFVDSINESDKIGILTHNDLDGIASAVFVEKILESKGKKVEFLDFLAIKNNMVGEILPKLKGLNLTKIFLTDLAVDNIDLEGFNELRKEIDCFLIDHHPASENLEKVNVIKSDTPDCAALAVYSLGEEILDLKEWAWLVCAAIFSDFSYKKEENFEFLKKFYPEVTRENLSYATPGMIARKISSALIYYLNDIKKVYDLVLEKNLSELDEINEMVEEEINRCVEEFRANAEFFSEENLYFYNVNSKLKIVSVVTTLVSKQKPEFSFVFFQEDGDYVKISARNQSSSRDMGELMKKGVAGLEDATGGGHAPASAARIRKEDLAKFKENILK